MPNALNASRLLARAVGIAARARLLADLVSDEALKDECAAIELEALNVRAMLVDTLRGSIDMPALLLDVDRRLRERGARLDVIETVRLGS
jgi:hypothetical protein